MTFLKSISTVFSKYANGKGRASRSEYWWWQLFVTLFFIIVLTVSLIIILSLNTDSLFVTIGKYIDTLMGEFSIFASHEGLYLFLGYTLMLHIAFPLLFLTNLILLLPSLCVSIRRCHDSGHSGWWVICPIVNIVMMFLPSDPNTNEYGEPEISSTERDTY